MCNGHYPTEKFPFGCSGYVTATAVTAGQSQLFYSGVEIFNWPWVLREAGFGLESGGLK